MFIFTFLLRGLACLSLLSINSLAIAACNATYNPTTGRLVIPCVDVPTVIPLVGTLTQTYSAELQQRPDGEYVFELDMATVKKFTNTAPYTIGDTGPKDGIVFYVDDTGAHGIEAQPADYDVGGTVNSNGSHGFTWLDAIVGAQSYGPGWHLPSKDELDLLYQQKDVVGGFDVNFNGYWSATEYDVDNAWKYNFSNGYQGYSYKGSTNLVRAVRAF